MLCPKKLKYSILTPLFEDASLKKKYEPILKYDKENYLALGKFVQKNIKGIISSDLDYHIPYLNKKVSRNDSKSNKYSKN